MSTEEATDIVPIEQRTRKPRGADVVDSATKGAESAAAAPAPAAAAPATPVAAPATPVAAPAPSSPCAFGGEASEASAAPVAQKAAAESVPAAPATSSTNGEVASTTAPAAAAAPAAASTSEATEKSSAAATPAAKPKQSTPAAKPATTPKAAAKPKNTDKGTKPAKSAKKSNQGNKAGAKAKKAAAAPAKQASAAPKQTAAKKKGGAASKQTATKKQGNTAASKKASKSASGKAKNTSTKSKGAQPRTQQKKPKSAASAPGAGSSNSNSNSNSNKKGKSKTTAGQGAGAGKQKKGGKGQNAGSAKSRKQQAAPAPAPAPRNTKNKQKGKGRAESKQNTPRTSRGAKAQTGGSRPAPRAAVPLRTRAVNPPNPPRRAPQRGNVARDGQGELSEQVLVPPELFAWAQTEEGAELADMVQDRARIIAVDYTVTRSGRGAFTLIAPTLASLRKARALLGMSLQSQIRLAEVERVKNAAARSLHATEQEIAQGLRVEFKVDKRVLGLVFGKGGANIQRVKQETGVSRIHVDPSTATVYIRGDDPIAVQDAKDRLDFVDILVEVPADQVGFLLGVRGETIRSIQRDSGVMTLQLQGGDKSVVRITGTRVAADSAQLLMQTKLEFAAKERAAAQEARKLRARQNRIDQQYGDASGYNNNSSAMFGDSDFPEASFDTRVVRRAPARRTGNNGNNSARGKSRGNAGQKKAAAAPAPARSNNSSGRGSSRGKGGQKKAAAPAPAPAPAPARSNNGAGRGKSSKRGRRPASGERK